MLGVPPLNMESKFVVALMRLTPHRTAAADVKGARSQRSIKLLGKPQSHGLIGLACLQERARYRRKSARYCHLVVMDIAIP
jgi:hypothetical protein